MAISGASAAVATGGPTQDIAYVPVDINAAGPDGGETGRALAVVQVDGAGAPIGTATNPVIVAPGPGGTGVTLANLSITNMTGASQTVLAAGAGDGLIYMQAPSTNAGTIWISLPGGTAVVGSGVPILPGGYLIVQPGIANAITGIAATALDDLTVYAG